MMNALSDDKTLDDKISDYKALNDKTLDNKGFIYTLDAVLALIPIFIVFLSLAQFTGPANSQSQVRLSHNAQDSLEMMGQYREGGGMNLLERISNIMAMNNNNKKGIELAGNIATDFLNKNLQESEYLLCEENVLKGARIAGNLNLNNAKELSSATRNCGNYTYHLYIGKN